MASKTQETATAADNLINIWKGGVKKVVAGGEVDLPTMTEATKATIEEYWPGFVEAMDGLVRARSL